MNKNLDMGQKMYIFIPFHTVNQFQLKRAENYYDYKCDIDFLQQFNKRS